MKHSNDCEFCRAGAPLDPEEFAAWIRAKGWDRPPPRHVQAISKHLERVAGCPVWFVSERRQAGPVPIDVCVAGPTRDRDTTILVTAGMSDLPMRPPEEEGADLCWGEVAMSLPGDWRMDRESLRTNRWGWPIEVLRLIVHHAHTSDAWVWYHHLIDFVNRFDASVPFDAALLDGAYTLPEEILSIPVGPGKEVNVLSVIPLYREEYEYGARKGGAALCRKLKLSGVTEVMNPRRASTVSKRSL